MSWEANTIQVPKELVKKVISGHASAEAIYAFCLQEIYPTRSMEEIGKRFRFEPHDLETAEQYVGASDTSAPRERQRPQQRNQSGSGERKQYDKSPESPPKFKEWLRRQVDEAIPDSFEVRDTVADAIYEKAGGDKQYILDAIETTRDYHENKEEVKSPGALLLSQITRFDVDKLHSMAEAVRNNGTAVKDRSKRMSRAMERAGNYVKAKGNPIEPDPEFFDDEEEDDE